MTKTSFVSIALGATLLVSNASAQTAQGGFSSAPAQNSTITIAEIANLPDDSMIMLQGNILNKIGHETYLFQDKTGTINVEIDNDEWNALTVSPDDVVI